MTEKPKKHSPEYTRKRDKAQEGWQVGSAKASTCFVESLIPNKIEAQKSKVKTGINGRSVLQRLANYSLPSVLVIFNIFKVLLKNKTNM